MKYRTCKYCNKSFECRNALKVFCTSQCTRDYKRTVDIAQYKAHQAVTAAIRRGDLTAKTACERCGVSDKRMYAHHPDYAKPLDVIWVCASCHYTEHSNLKDHSPTEHTRTNTGKAWQSQNSVYMGGVGECAQPVKLKNVSQLASVGDYHYRNGVSR